ncbi:hypothetical protein CYMTET_4071 [Cymbomonas tetramitiformis]|uniref:Uncharacterized protein n=1 Tax=Cymbomonas tetramitiformis TaxID=36881 RepID=A0AAE0LKV1_9CHLO|nr:hypothetical protein CYMTET_4071 [Cymbomonas tetramitiformis]
MLSCHKLKRRFAQRSAVKLGTKPFLYGCALETLWPKFTHFGHVSLTDSTNYYNTQLGGVFLLAMSTVAAIMVPQALNRPKEEGGGKLAAKKTADRLIGWGLILGICFGGLQLACLPLLNFFSPLPEVQEAAVLPSIIGAVLQIINGVVFIAEGIMQGHQEFGLLARNSAVSAACLVGFLYFFGSTLPGVWGSFWAFNISRLLFALHHHFIAGPLAPCNMANADDDTTSKFG